MSASRSGSGESPSGGSSRALRPRVLALVGLLAVALVSSTSCSSPAKEVGPADPSEAALAGLSVDVHKQVGCGCCDEWVAYLREHGAEVVVAADPGLAQYRQELGVPAAAAGCHTAAIDGFVVEGHVPVPAIVGFSDRSPQAIGIAVPGMPVDGPGMGGNEESWNAMNVLLILSDGGLSPFDF